MTEPKAGDLLRVVSYEYDWFMGWARPDLHNGSVFVASQVRPCKPGSCKCKKNEGGWTHHIWQGLSSYDLRVKVAVLRTAEELAWDLAHPIRSKLHALWRLIRHLLFGGEGQWVLQTEPEPRHTSDDEVIAQAIALGLSHYKGNHDQPETK